MTTIKQLLGQGDVKKCKRNFLQENIKRLKEVNLNNGSKPNTQNSKNIQPLSERKITQQKVSGVAKVPPVAPRRPVKVKAPSVEVLDQHIAVTTPSEDFTPKGYRTQASQTLDGHQLETMYYEGVVRYPSSRAVSRGVSMREMALQTQAEPPDISTTDVSLQCENVPPTTEDVLGGCDATSEIQKSSKIAESKCDPCRAPMTYQRGVVPRYIKAQKKEQERINQAREAADECPEGHVMLPQDIRLSHLTTLKQKYEELVGRLNQLPVSTDSLRTRTRKKEIEQELDKIEAAIAIFSREKVFVKSNS